MLWCAMMNGGMGYIAKFVGLPPEWWLISLMLTVAMVVFLLCTIMIRGWMPRDKPNWDNFGKSCFKEFHH
jgi:hypothetical protein